MTLYCQIIDGVIHQPQELPETFAGISNFFAVDPVLLPSFGWFPFVPAQMPAYQEATQKLVQSLELVNNQVIESWQVVSMTPEEQAAFATARLTEIGNRITPFLNESVDRKSYENHVSARTVKDSSNAGWAKDGREAWAYYDLVWEQFTALQAGVQAGTTPLPTVEGWFASLPVLWPAPPLDNSNGTLSGNMTLS